MATPSIHLVLIITFLQVIFHFHAEGFTMPLQTVAKCESFTIKNPKPKQECVVNDKPAASVDVSYTPLDNCVPVSTVNPLNMQSGVLPSINLQEGLCNVAPSSVKQACFVSKLGPDLLSARPGTPISGMNLPIPSPKVTNVCNTKISDLNSGIIEDATSKVTNPSLFSNQFSAPNSGFNNIPAGYPNSYDSEINSYLSSANHNLYRNCNQDGQLSVTPFNNVLVPTQQAMNMGSLANEVPSPSASLATNQAPVGYNDFNKIGNNLQNALSNSNFSPTPHFESLSNFPQNSEPNKLTSISFNKPSGTSTANSIPPGLTLPSTADPGNSLSLSCSSNYVPTSPLYNANSCGPNNQVTQLPLSSDQPSAGLPVIFKDPVIYPTIQTYPPSNMCPVLPQQHLLEQNYLIPNEPMASPNICNLLNQRTSVNEYFKNVRAATARLNDFITAFSNRLGSQNIPLLPSFSKTLSQIPSLVNTLPVEERLESTLLSLDKPKSPSTTLTLQNIIPCEESVPVTPTAPTKNPNICTPSASAPLSPVSLNAPKVPTLTVNKADFPICSSPIQYNSFQDTLASVSSSNYSPQPITNLPTAISSNPYTNLGTCSKLREGSSSLTNICKRLLSLPSVLKRPIFNNFKSPKHIIPPFEEGTSTLLPDVLSNVFPKISSKCKKPFPFIPPAPINTSLDCDCSASASNMNACEFDLSSLQNSCVSSKPNLDESQLDECCKNLENVIAMLELSLNLNGDIDCDLDCVPDILSAL